MAAKFARQEQERHEDERLLKERESISQKHKELMEKQKQKEMLKEQHAQEVARAWNAAMQESKASEGVRTSAHRTRQSLGNENENPVRTTPDKNRIHQQPSAVMTPTGLSKLTQDKIERLEREVFKRNEETKMELAKLTSQMEGHYKKEIATLHRKAEQLEKDRADAQAELDKLRIELLMKNSTWTPRNGCGNREHLLPSLPAGWWDACNRLDSKDRFLEACSRDKVPFLDAASIEKPNKNIPAVRTPMSIPKGSLETVWLYPDGKVLPDMVRCNEQRKKEYQREQNKGVCSERSFASAKSCQSDPETLLCRNESKLKALKDMRTNSGNIDSEALESFLKKYVARVPASENQSMAKAESRCGMRQENLNASYKIEGDPQFSSSSFETARVPSRNHSHTTGLDGDSIVLTDKHNQPGPSNGSAALQSIDSVGKPPLVEDALDLEICRLQNLAAVTLPSPSADAQSQLGEGSGSILVADSEWLQAL